MIKCIQNVEFENLNQNLVLIKNAISGPGISTATANFMLFLAKVGKTVLQNLVTIATACQLSRCSTYYQNVPNNILGKVTNFGYRIFLHCRENFKKNTAGGTKSPSPLPARGGLTKVVTLSLSRQSYRNWLKEILLQ